MSNDRSTAAAAPALEGTIAVRRLSKSDSFDELTLLLHRAYRGQVEMGLRPLAGRQDAATQRQILFRLKLRRLAQGCDALKQALQHGVERGVGIAD